MGKYFKKANNTFIVEANKVEAFIPERYTTFKFCAIEEDVSVFGIFDLKINDSEWTGFIIPNIITLAPNEIDTVTLDEERYIHCTFYKGDVFMKSRTVIKNKFLIIKMFKEFIGYGNIPRFITYDNCHKLFATVKSMAGMDLNLEPAVMEMVWAFLYRLSDDLRIQARFGTPKQKKEFISLRNVTYAPDSTTAKIFGSYMSDGLNSALVNPNEENKPLEDIMRL